MVKVSERASAIPSRIVLRLPRLPSPEVVQAHLWHPANGKRFVGRVYDSPRWFRLTYGNQCWRRQGSPYERLYK